MNHETLYQVFKNEEALYLQFKFHVNFLEHMHKKYSHLSHSELLRVVQLWAWWHSLNEDIQSFVSCCANCQITQCSWKEQETEQHSYLAWLKLLLFKWWDIDLIKILPQTSNDNWWIITAIDYAIRWLVAKAVKNVTEEQVTDFLHDEIFMNYRSLKKLLSDNEMNFLSWVVAYYL